MAPKLDRNKLKTILATFNRGLISALALARVDIDRVLLSSVRFCNYLPRMLGSMMLRPGLEYTVATRDNLYAVTIPFIFSNDDTADMEFTDQTLRIKVDDVLVARESVATTIQSGDFSAATGWTDNDENGATSTISSGVLSLLGTGYNTARRTQTVTVAGGDVGKEHGLKIVVQRGPVVLKVGSTSTGDEYINETMLGTGTHSLGFTPTGTFYINFSSRKKYTVIVDSCEIEAAGVMEIATPWLEDDIDLIRVDQSLNVVYAACNGYQGRKIERRPDSGNAWSVVLYEPEDGPFRVINTSNIQLTAGALYGDTTLTASSDFFRSGHVGALFKLTSNGQAVEADIAAADQWTDYIKVTGVGIPNRKVNVVITGTWVGTVQLQRSYGEPGNWVDANGTASWTGNTSTSYDDGADNQIIYYRIGIKAGGFTSGVAEVHIDTPSGGITGMARVTAYNSRTSVNVVVLKDFGGLTSTLNWYEGAWSSARYFPAATVLHEGRNWWSGFGKISGSVSDAYESFDDEVEGESAPIVERTIPGKASIPNWLLSLARLIIGTDSSAASVRSSSLDEILTTTNFNIKIPVTLGTAPVAPAKCDAFGLYVEKSRNRLFKVDLNIESDDYKPEDLSALIPDYMIAGIVRIAIQRIPDTRAHCVMADGTAMIIVFDELENVKCWFSVETQGLIEDVYIRPGITEDKVYYTVLRDVDGNDVRYHERWAMENDCQGGVLNKQADSFITYTGVSTTTITGLDHLEGCEVIVWGNQKDLTYDFVNNTEARLTVTGGQITLPEAVTNAVIGLFYKAQFKSTKLAYSVNLPSALLEPKKVDHVGFILRNTHARGIRYGGYLDNEDAPLDDMPEVEDGADVDPNYLWPEYDKEDFEFDGDWDTDSRVCFESYAPRPCTILCLKIAMVTNEK